MKILYTVLTCCVLIACRPEPSNLGLVLKNASSRHLEQVLITTGCDELGIRLQNIPQGGSASWFPFHKKVAVRLGVRVKKSGDVFRDCDIDVSVGMAAAIEANHYLAVTVTDDNVVIAIGNDPDDCRVLASGALTREEKDERKIL